MSEYFMWCEPTFGTGQRYSNKLCFVKPLLSWPFPSTVSLTFTEFHPPGLSALYFILFYFIDLCLVIFIAVFLSAFLPGHHFPFCKQILSSFLYLCLFHILSYMSKKYQKYMIAGERCFCSFSELS